MAKTRRSTRAERRAAARDRARARVRSRMRWRRRWDTIPAPLRSPILWAVVVLVVGGATGYATWRARQPVGLPPEPAPVPARDVTSFRIVYDVRDTAGQEELRKTEVVEVRRPFEERIESRDGPPPGAEPDLVTITNREYLWNLKRGGEVNFGMRRQPGVAHRDAVHAALEEAADAGVIERRGTRNVLGRACDVFAYKEPRPQPLEPPGDKDHVESCVSDDGLVLHEEWTLNGRLAITKRAVTVEENVEFADERFFVGRVPENEPNYETFRVLLDTQSVTEDAEPDRAVLTPDLPAGFTLDRKALNFESGGGAAAPRNSYYQSYLRGSDEIVILDQGVMRAERAPWTSDEGVPIDIGRRWEARVVYFEDRVELRRWRSNAEAVETHFYRVQAPSLQHALWFMLTLD